MDIPINLIAEQSLLGTILANNSTYSQVSEFLGPYHFADGVNAAIYGEIQKRLSNGRVVDAISLRSHFAQTKELDDAGGIDYLGQLLAAMVSPMVAGEYGRTILEAAHRRHILEVAEKLKYQSLSAVDLADIAQTLSQAADAITDGASSRQSVLLSDAIDMALAQADAVAKGDTMRGVRFGMPSVDEAIGGLEESDMVVLAARPGAGKTALAVKWALHVARQGIGVEVVSMEMTAAALGRRVLCAAANVPLWALKQGRHAEFAEALIQARKEFIGLPFSIDDAGRATMSDIGSMANRAKKKHGLGLIVIDHLQIARSEGVGHGPTANLTEISHEVKALAKRMRCPVLALSQLSRGLEGREDKTPTLADLRQSGAIEEDADVVAFVHRPEMYIPNSPPSPTKGTDEAKSKIVAEYHKAKAAAKGVAELILAKNREGALATVSLRFEGRTADFVDPEHDLPSNLWED